MRNVCVPFLQFNGKKPPTAEVRKKDVIGQKEVERPEKTETRSETAVQPSMKNARFDPFTRQFVYFRCSVKKKKKNRLIYFFFCEINLNIETGSRK